MIQWVNITSLLPKSYTCGYCGHSIASEKGWNGVEQPSGRYFGIIYICHFCLKPTFFDNLRRQTPGSVFGEMITGIDDKNVEDLYTEARNCMSSNSYTAAVLSCRKLLMNIAVSKGAKAGLNFVDYVQFLSDKNFIPPGAKDWVDHIRKKGNEANHEITIMNKESAEDLLSFCSMLLKIIFEFPATVKKRTSPVEAAS